MSNDDGPDGSAATDRAGDGDPDGTDGGDSDGTAGTFLVTHADAGSAVVRDVERGRVHTLASNPGVEPGDVLEATLAPDPPMEVTWRVVEVRERRTVTVTESDEPPTRQEREVAAALDVGELARRERAGAGELHVLSVPPAEIQTAVEDVTEDEQTVARAARLGVSRVEIRSAVEDGEGIVSVRYLP